MIFELKKKNFSYQASDVLTKACESTQLSSCSKLVTLSPEVADFKIQEFLVRKLNHEKSV
jgi:hypothetical protein